MANDFDAAASWERVAAELRACREAQQRAWGNIDNATLGRYLAGELGGEERRQVEQALEALPELRRLTDLVRDVLADCGPELVPAPEPAVRRAPQSAVLRLWRHSASLVSLATAAGLLLALGLSLPRLGDTPVAGTAPATPLGGGVALRGDSPVFFTAMRPAGPALPRQAPAPEDALARMEQMDRAVVSLEKKGRRKEALVLAQQYEEVVRKAQLEHHPRLAFSLNRVGQLYLEEGDLAAAEPPLQQALAIAKRELGPQHPATVWARNRLAGVYQVALNAPPPAPPAPAAPPRSEGTESARAATAPNSSSNTYLFHANEDKKSAEQALRTARALRERITRMGPHRVRTAVVPVLARALEESPSDRERQAAARALGQLGPAARDAVPALVTCLRRAATPQECRALADALIQIGPAARDGVASLGLDHRSGRSDPLLEACRRLKGRDGLIGVNDGGECFSVGALRRSARAIHALADHAGIELRVETAPALPPDAIREAKGRLREMGPRGVCVLIGKDGPDVRVWAAGGLATDGLRQAVAERCRRRDYDGALAESVRFVSEQAKKKISRQGAKDAKKTKEK